MAEQFEQPLLSKAEMDRKAEMVREANNIKRKPSEKQEIQNLIVTVQSFKENLFQKLRYEKTLEGHSDYIASVTFSPDGKFLASGSCDRCIKIWNLAENCEEFQLQGHSDKVNSVAFSPDGNFLVSGSNDDSIKLWNLAEKREEFQLQGHSSSIYSVAFSPDGKFLASGSNDKSIIIWNLSEKRQEFQLQGHSDYVCSVAFSPDSKLLASGSADETIKVWDLNKQSEEIELKGYSDYISSVAFSPDGKLLASGSNDNSVSVWNLAEKSEKFQLQGHSDWVESTAFSPDGKFLASGSGDKSIIVWNLSEKREEFQLLGHSSYVTSVAFSPDGKILASGSCDGSIKLWNLAEKRGEFKLQGHSDHVKSVAFSPDSKLLASGSGDKSIKVWNLAEKREEFQLQGHSDYIMSVAFSHDGKFLASGSGDKSIKVWNLTEKREEFELQGHSSWLESIVFSPDGKFLASGSGDNTVKVWNLAEKREEFQFQGHSSYVTSIAFSPDSRLLASGSADKIIIIWNMAEKCKESQLQGNPGNITSIAYSPDGKLLASASESSIIIWNLIDKREEFRLQGHFDNINSVAFSPNGKFLASGSGDNNIKIWNLIEKRQEFQLQGHESCVECIAFSPDGKLLASGSDDNSINVWNLQVLSEKFEVAEFVESALNAEPAPTHQNALHLDFSSLSNPRYQNFLDYFNALCMISQSRWMDIRQWDILISNLNFTPLHLVAFNGDSAAIQEALKTGNFFRVLADEFGHSPIHYSIIQKHQAITDIILDYIAQQAQMSISTYAKTVNFHAIRNDFIEIIQSSPKSLANFLNECLYSPTVVPIFGEAENPIILLDTAGVSFTDFLKSEEVCKNPKPLRIKVSRFRVPATIGSGASISLLKVLLELRDTEAFKTEFVRLLIRYRWDQLKKWIYLYTGFLWINLLLVGLMLSGLDGFKFFITSILLIFTNLMLIIWEALQYYSTGLEYIKDAWNLIDILRGLLTTSWPFLVIFKLNFNWLAWILVLLNIIRGLTGFRAFDNTRFYIKLIFESFKDVSYFLAIFSYTTLSFGLLGIAQQEKMDFTVKWLWINSFGLAVGAGNDEFEDFSLQYVTYLIAIVMNVIFMLNMIISIFSDSYDKFQLLANFYSSIEMIEVILELETIAFLSVKSCEFKFIHVIENFYKEEDYGWQGKIIENRELQKITNNKIADIEGSIKGEIQTVKGGISAKIDLLERQTTGKINSLEDKISSMETKIEGKIDEVDRKLQALFDLLQAK